MIQPPQIERIDYPRESSAREKFFQSDVWHAVVASFAGSIVISFLLPQIFDVEFIVIARLVFALVGIIFFLVMIGRVLNVFARTKEAQVSIARAQAELEKIIGIDLNQSGGIGDVKSLAAPQIIEQVDENEVRDRFARHCNEFWKQIENGVRSAKREDWLRHTNTETGRVVPAYQFDDGKSISRSEYDAICRFWMAQGELKNRRKGKTGDLLTQISVAYSESREGYE